MGNEMVVVVVRLPGRHVEKPDTLVLFPSSVREQKIEGLDLYTYTGSPGKCVYLCPRFELKFSTGQVAPKPDSTLQNQTPGNPREEKKKKQYSML